MNDTYHLRELQDLRAQLHRNELAPLSDRREAQSEAAALMRDTDRISRNLEWLLSGNYGAGAQIEARRIAEMRRGNREAQEVQLLAALDCFCPARNAIAAWKSLTPAEQDALAFAVRSTLDLCEAKS
jgi:hypothetical protein